MADARRVLEGELEMCLPLFSGILALGSFHVKSSEILENFNPTPQKSLKFSLVVEIYEFEKSLKFF